MQQKCLKSDIYVNENLICESLEQAIDVDFTLPDFCPDISKIFKCHAVPRISSKAINGSSITIDGNVIITILYCDKDGNFCSYEYLYPFSKTVELKEDATGCNAQCRIKCDYINCRAVTGRKVDIHGAAGIGLRVFKRKCNEVICDIEESSVEFKRITAPATVPMGYAEKYITIEEDLPLSAVQGTVQSILKTNSAVCVKETKIINDKAVVKGELAVCVLYCPEGGGGPVALKSALPYSQIVDMEGVNETCESHCKAEITNLEVRPKANAAGELKCISLMAKILVCCEAYCGNDIPIISDAFSRKFAADIKRKTLTFDKLTSNINETYTCKKSINLDFNVNSVIDLWCSMQTSHTKFEEGKMSVCGTLIAGMIVCDEENRSLYIEKPIDFEYKYPFESKLGLPHCDPEIEVLSCSFTILSPDNIELTAVLGINAGIYEKKDISLISDMSIDESKVLKKSSDCAMVIYFANDGDSVWDVANKFSASVNEITEINNIENHSLAEGTMLLVPIN